MVGSNAVNRESAARDLTRLLHAAWYYHPNGTVRLYPDYSAAGDGEPVRVPVSAVFEVLL